MRTNLIISIVLWLICTQQAIQAQNNDTSLQLQIKSEKGETLPGVYVVNKSRYYLITSSDEEGNCEFELSELAPTDSIQFASLGFKDVILTAKALTGKKEIVLQEKAVALQEVSVIAIKPEALLKKAAKNIQQRPDIAKNNYNYYGKAQYMKITECHDRAVEYRREYGCFFTSGSILKKVKFDQHYDASFVTAYAARSYNLTPDGQDTLYPLHMLFNHRDKIDRDYIAESKKIYTLMRTLQVYGPLFTDLKYYNFRLIDNSDGYTYEFRSNKENRLKDIRIICNGTMTIDPTTARLRKITVDYIDYNMYMLTHWKSTVASPYTTRAEVEIVWGADGKANIKRCIQTTTWKRNAKIIKSDIENSALGIRPSRRNPGKNQLVEKEAFVCNQYLPYPQKYRDNQRYYVAISRAAFNPCGEYDPVLFASLPEPLESAKTKKELNEYMNIEEQFRRHSNKPYLDPDYFTDYFDIIYKRYGELTIYQYANMLEILRQRVVAVFVTQKTDEIDFNIDL